MTCIANGRIGQPSSPWHPARLHIDTKCPRGKSRVVVLCALVVERASCARVHQRPVTMAAKLAAMQPTRVLLRNCASAAHHRGALRLQSKRMWWRMMRWRRETKRPLKMLLPASCLVQHGGPQNQLALRISSTEMLKTIGVCHIEDGDICRRIQR